MLRVWVLSGERSHLFLLTDMRSTEGPLTALCRLSTASYKVTVMRAVQGCCVTLLYQITQSCTFMLYNVHYSKKRKTR